MRRDPSIAFSFAPRTRTPLRMTFISRSFPSCGRPYLVRTETCLPSLMTARAAALPYIAVSACTATRLTSSMALILAHLYPYPPRRGPWNDWSVSLRPLKRTSVRKFLPSALQNPRALVFHSVHIDGHAVQPRCSRRKNVPAFLLFYEC